MTPFMTLLEQRSETRPAVYEAACVSPEDCQRALQTPLQFLKGVGPVRAAQLEGLGLRTIEDLLYHLPFRYEDRRQIKNIAAAVVGREDNFVGELIALQKKFIPRRRRQMLVGTIADASGALGLVWYRGTPYISKGLSKGQRLWVHGTVERGIGVQNRIVHPEFEVLEPESDKELEKILPIYVRPAGVALGSLRRWLQQALADFGRYLPSYLPDSVARRQGLLDLKAAMLAVHQPDKQADPSRLNQAATAAHRSIVFDEFFYLQLGLNLRRKQLARQKGIVFQPGATDLVARMRELLPFRLTAAQERVLGEIHRDMESPLPMQRLVQGDVGSGKTMVGWLAALRAIQNGYQALWLAPTELLAEQHFRNLEPLGNKLGLRVALLTGSQGSGQKRAHATAIERGEVSFIVGTHALIQEGIRAPRMGFGVIDEQHRFGVLQRMALQRLGRRGLGSSLSRAQPDMLLMSATPIPRSLAMVIYGDVEVSSLDEIPPGRKPVRTQVFDQRERPRIYRLVREEIERGYQAFIVFPLVEASEQLELADATRMADELARGMFKDCKLGLIHGRMSAAERDSVMCRFRDGELRILVATTVIEVGIDIPNATVMVVEHAERFGLSQLHQLRGRVGRGSAPGQCFLVRCGPGSADAARRLEVMEQECNGFKIAEADLVIRGPGEFLGTRQSGLADFRLANLIRDAQLLIEARREAIDWLSRDGSLKSPQSANLRRILMSRWGQRLELGGIG